jgi:hypothetical protein
MITMPDGIILAEGNVIEVVGMPCLESGTLRRINKTSDGLHLYIFCGCIDGMHALSDPNLQSAVHREAVTLTKI